MSLLNLDWSFVYLIAQSNSGSGDVGGEIFILIIDYVFTSYCFYVMLQKVGYPNAWFAWVPILSQCATYEANDRSAWWEIGQFIPLVNIFVGFLLLFSFVNIVKKLGKNPWLIILLMIPFFNLFVMYHFAFG
ncbi:MAG: DUF5684 domain-containing protein [Cyanobacteria bacterium P01_D01_bin.50]